ncbi:hypothetical protein [Legionella waltersii]|uniref:Uncharacterized protein n=1 Tax=Legionella waltersii TaxID=66969 RepID=A0A0W1ALM3_9GAMM|nr:hypothetical protein [Legionella waltersii]KTD82217.1 hypothetical protein Lwal_0694 [Legionella waltersii]SNV10781.1 Uncharacterised protein [Legionella waltersii]
MKSVKNSRERSSLKSPQCLSFNEVLEIMKKLGGLDSIKEERFKGNLKPTEIAIAVLQKYISDSPSTLVVDSVREVKLLLGEEDCNVELLEGVEKAIRACETRELALNNTKVAKQLCSLSLQVLIKDSKELNESIQGPTSSPNV